MSKRPQILVLEDDSHLGAMYPAFLPDCAVYCFPQPDQALGFAERNPVDLAIIDIVIGTVREAGLAVIVELARKSGPFLPVIAVTGTAGDGLAARCLDAGAYDFVTKPFWPGEFRARVHRHLATAAALARAAAAPAKAAPKPEAFEFVGARIRLADNTIQCPDMDEPMSIFPKYAQLLYVFHQSEGSILRKDVLVKKVWGADADLNGNSVVTYLCSLRGLYRKHRIILATWIRPQYGVGWHVLKAPRTKKNA